ncbi:TPA: hypothetical protein ACPWSX_004710 [Pseudomonas aeruginosa]
MNKANECSCPSGDGSLVHPCPAHPAVEQAGGDERVIGWRERILAAHPNSDPGFWPDALLVEHMAAEIADLRAALAQPSPAQAEQHWPKLEKPAQVGAIRFSAGVSSRLVVEAAQRLYEFESTPEKEAERIERLQAFREQCFEPLGTEFSKVLSENLVELSSDAKPEQAEAERPEIVATLFTPNEKVHNVIGFKAFAVAGDCDKEGGEFYDPEKLMTVAQHARIVGALRAKADQLREALEWRAENQAGQRELLRSVKAERDAALAEVAGLRSLLNSLLCYVERDIDRMRSDRDKSDNKEIYDRSISLAMERLKAAQNAVFTTEPGCDTAVELAAQTTQAQHSVPEVSGIGRDFAYPRSVVLYLRTEPTDDDLRAIHDGLRSLAAAPGKEVPQAWLDVQAERRRQVEAEGWTPEHDDLYCAAELPRAAAAYILNGANDEAPAIWPFSAKWWKPRDARSNYVRASALILAEIERLDRAAPGKEGNDD